jgi:hypothetical protein
VFINPPIEPVFIPNPAVDEYEAKLQDHGGLISSTNPDLIMRVYGSIPTYIRGIAKPAFSEFVFKRMNLTPSGNTTGLKRATGKVFKNATFAPPIYCVYPGSFR